jgi:hypothetical protein
MTHSDNIKKAQSAIARIDNNDFQYNGFERDIETIARALADAERMREVLEKMLKSFVKSDKDNMEFTYQWTYVVEDEARKCLDEVNQ